MQLTAQSAITHRPVSADFTSFWKLTLSSFSRTRMFWKMFTSPLPPSSAFDEEDDDEDEDDEEDDVVVLLADLVFRLLALLI